MRGVSAIIPVLFAVAATHGPPRQTAVALATATAVVQVQPAQQPQRVEVLIQNDGDGAGLLTSVAVADGEGWSLEEPWEPRRLEPGETVAVAVWVEPGELASTGTLRVLADGMVEPAAGCDPGSEAAPDSLDIQLFRGGADPCDREHRAGHFLRVGDDLH